MNYWPGTKIIKSENNAFTEWKQGRSRITTSRDWKQSEASTLQTAGSGTNPRKQFTIYSRAKVSK